MAFSTLIYSFIPAYFIFINVAYLSCKFKDKTSIQSLISIEKQLASLLEDIY